MRRFLPIFLLPVLAVAAIAQVDSSRVAWQIGGMEPDTGIEDALLTSDGSSIITGDDLGYLRVWPVGSVSLPRVVLAHEDGVAAVAQIDDSTIVTAGRDNVVRLWNWPDLTPRREVRDSLMVTAFWRLDGDTVLAAISGDNDKYPRQLITIDIATGDTTVVTPLGSTYRDRGVVVDPRTGLAVCVGSIHGDSVHVVDVRTREWPYALRFKSWSRSADIASDSGLFVLFDGETGRCEWRRLSDGVLIDSLTYQAGGPVRVDRSGNRCLVISGGVIALFSRGDTAIVRRALTRAPWGLRTVNGGFVGRGDTVWIVGTYLGGVPARQRFPTVAVIDPAGNVRDMSWLTEAVRSVWFIDNDASVRVGTTRTAATVGRETAALRAIDQCTDCARVLAIDGQYERYSYENPESSISGVLYYRQIDGRWNKLIEYITDTASGVPAPGGNYFLYRGLWKRDKDTTVSLPGIYPAGFSYDATMLVRRVSTGDVIILRTSDGALLQTLYGPTTAVSMAFSKDGQRVAVAYTDDTIRVYDVASGARICALPPGRARVVPFVFSARGTHLVGGRRDGAIVVWDLGIGQIVETLQHSAPITAVDVSADGRWIVSGSEDRTITMWKPRGQVGAAPAASPAVEALDLW